MKKLIYLFIVLLMFSRPVLADDLQDVDALVKGKVNAVISLLKRTDIDKKERNRRILDIVKPFINFEQMAKLSLGKKHWLGISKEKRQEYSRLFVKRLEESYIEKLDLYSNEDVVFYEPKQVRKKIHVLTSLDSKNGKVDMLYKLYRSKKGWQVYDVEVLGVSIVQTYRSQFNGILQKGNIDDLLAKLQTGEIALPVDKRQP